MKEIITLLAANYGTSINKINGGGDDLAGNVTGIMNGIVGALALVAVVVVIMGGVKYMTSNGDAGKVKTAKDTILYGLIGLIVCALAAAIVNFVIANILGNS